MRRFLLAALVLGGALTTPVLAQAKPATDNMAILRDKIRADKKLLVADNLQLTDAESQKFWPVYDAFQADLSKLNQRTGKLIERYAGSYDTMTDDVAKGLLDEMIAIEVDRTALLKSYQPKVLAVLSPRKAARYYQIENKIRAAINYELADLIPLMK